ncbi:chitobiase/beta-hexosaminidase C-terminal domain-containing protein [Verrucomicrobiaceae bacterium N1E253]|uniref:Chitobiase/beta-hexosaminidase C-terminal domain-containing protein n=1 Tax=Oceaniferula marina TaxID=2748318 RepID=A0A851GCM1_9BACT|nr:DUF6288 domain-containing protein [Oceaniferula marina]NWK55313.1 chitobiase/beta-hexosaminidase C-terminal domain-containing protein [Oceaniferula marina]
MHTHELIKKTLSVSVAIAAAWAPTAQALELDLPNPTLAPPKNAKADTPAVPQKWKVSDGDKEACLTWHGQDQYQQKLAHTAITPGTTLSCELTIPELTEKEQKAEPKKKGHWTGVLSLDHLGLTKNGRSSWELNVHEPGNKRAIASLKGSAKSTLRPDALQTHRNWVVLSPSTMTQLIGKKVQISLKVTGNAPLVVSGISWSRLFSAPSGKLFGRSNGGNGPDQLGAGSLGFDAMTEHRQRVLTIMNVRENSPAAKAGLKAGDMIVGVNRQPLPMNDLRPGWAWFYHSHEAVLGRAVAAAWSSKPPVGRGQVNLVVLRKGRPVTLNCRLTQSMDFSSITNSKDKANLHQELVQYLCTNQQKDGSWRGPIRTSFAALALLATKDPAHAPRVKQAVDWFLNKYPEPENYGGLGFWHSSYAGILFCEYYLATGDSRVLPYCSAILNWVLSGTHTSKWGMACLGHGIGGLPYGQKALVAPACHALVFDALAEKCGIRSGLWETLLPYMEHSWSDPSQGGHGSLGYNASYKDKGEFWSRTGLFAMAAHLRGERKDMEQAMTGFMRQSYPWIRNSHAYGEPGGSLGLLGLNLCNPEAYNEVMNAYGWWFALAWQPGYGLRFTTPHMGAPYMGTDDLISATYALVLAAPEKSLFITGGNQRNWLNVSDLPTPPSPVIARRARDGKVQLSCKVPGPSIRYTLDGSPPSKESSLYEQALDLPNGGTVKARSYSTGSIKPGEISEFQFGPAKAGWKVLAASGHQQPEEALRRAYYAIDHDPGQSWLTDVGQDASGYPHFIVIDLGQETKLSSVLLTFARDASSPKHATVKVSNSLTAAPRTVADVHWDTFSAQQTISLAEPQMARYLRLDFDQPFKEEGIALTIREIDVE